ncbi:MAG: hypothetical protein IPQ07_29235 [Myxococcales bacterium]|nr:hypothetical protein [Myxococcales bacterium]
MKFAPLFALVLAACGTDLGGPCSAADPCDSGSVCDLTNPEGAICVDAKGDDDGDGILNERDFCQHQMGGAYDEDQDGFGDDCDACPIAPPPAAPDTDGDDVDSPCDPDPFTPGDRIVVFTGFNEPTLPSTWKATTAWTFQGGEAKVTPATATGLETLSAPLPLVSTNIALLTRYRVDRVDPAATESAASVIGIDRRPAGTTIVSCGGSRVAAMDRLLLDTGVGGSQDAMDQLFDPAGLYRVAIKLEGAQAQCAMISDRETGAAQAASNGEAMSEAGLTARGATIRFTYLLAVQRGPVGTN